MSYELKALKHSPQGLWMMDDTTPLQEYSPYNRNGTTTGTVGQHPAVCSSALYASILGKGATALYDAPVFIQGREAQPFAIEAWAKSIVRTKGLTAQAYRENLCPNPTVELNATGWTTGGNANLTRSTTRAWTGAAALSVVAPAAGAARAYFTPDPAKMVIGATYKTTAYIYTADSAVTVKTEYGGDNFSGGDEGLVTLVPNTWTKVVATRTITQWTTNPRLQFVLNNMTLNGTAWIDAVILEQTNTLLPYFDGSVPGYEWTGTAYNSTSRTRTNVNRVNLAPQTPGNYNSQSTGPRALDGTNGIYATGVSWNGSTWNRMTWNGTGNNILREYTSSEWLVSGRTYTIGATLGNDGATSVSLSVDWCDNSITSYTILPGQTITVRIAASRTAYDNIYRFIDFAPNVASNFLIKDYYIEDTTNTTLPYFNGNSPGTEWSGAANSSASIMLVSDGEQQVLGNPGQMDGITVNGTVVSFVTKYTTSGECRVSYDLQRNHRFYAVGLHNKEKNSLFINGELVGETNLTDAQKADTYTSASSQLASGDTVSGRGLAINAVAAYAGTISPSIIRAHWDYGSTYATPEAAVTPFGGVNVPLDKSYMNRFLDITWTNDEDFFTGLLNGLVVRDGLRPDSDTGVSLPGNWVTAIPLDPVTQTSIYGATIEWLGQGFVVETSQDGITWTTATNGAPLSTVPNNSDPTDDILNIRVTFPGGITNDTSVMSYLNVTGFSSSSYQSILQTPQSLTYPAMPDTAHDPIDYHDDYGLSLNGGSLTVTPGDPYRTIEVWLKPESAGITYNITPTTGYENGTAGIALAAGEWSLLHLTFNSDQATPVTFSGTGQIGIVSIYPLQLTASQVSDVYASYTGRPVIRVVDSNAIAMVEPASPVLSYAYDWAITAAGR